MKVSLCSHTVGMLTSALDLRYASESVTYRFIQRCGDGTAQGPGRETQAL